MNNGGGSLATDYTGPEYQAWLSQGYGGNSPSVGLDEGSGFDLKGGLGTASLAMQGVTGLMGAYNAYQQNKLLKKQFGASLADRNQNVANQAATTNLGLTNQAAMAAQMMGNKYGSQGYDQYVKDNRVQVDGSPIKV